VKGSPDELGDSPLTLDAEGVGTVMTTHKPATSEVTTSTSGPTADGRPRPVMIGQTTDVRSGAKVPVDA
jgi:hypothetical protein